MTKTKVINIFGAPSTGKSTLASGLFYEMKMRGCAVELAYEYIKDKVYEGSPYPFQDQLYTFAKQNKKIRQLVGKVDYVICDSPLLQGLVYQSDKEPKVLTQTILDYFNMYDNVNILLHRNHKFQEVGRVHSEEESKRIGEQIESTLQKYNIPYTVLPTNNALENMVKIFEMLESEHKQ